MIGLTDFAAKKVALAHDLSAVGRCALSVALPVLSFMGAQGCPLPTAVLSAHTGGFGTVARQDLTGFMRGAIAHWDSLALRFDAVYIGYLADDAQLELCAGLVAGQRALGAPFVLIDPVMADHGRLYCGISEDRPERMRALCRGADLITPNPTEALLLLGREVGELEVPMDEKKIGGLLEGLLALRARAALITGAQMADGRHVNAYLSGGGQAALIPYEAAEGSYPGTGDVFASVLLGAILRGESAETAVRRAADFVRAAVMRTNRLGTPVREGVQFEALLKLL